MFDIKIWFAINSKICFSNATLVFDWFLLERFWTVWESRKQFRLISAKSCKYKERNFRNMLGNAQMTIYIRQPTPKFFISVLFPGEIFMNLYSVFWIATKFCKTIPCSHNNVYPYLILYSLDLTASLHFLGFSYETFYREATKCVFIRFITSSAKCNGIWSDNKLVEGKLQRESSMYERKRFPNTFIYIL